MKVICFFRFLSVACTSPETAYQSQSLSIFLSGFHFHFFIFCSLIAYQDIQTTTHKKYIFKWTFWVSCAGKRRYVSHSHTFICSFRFFFLLFETIITCDVILILPNEMYFQGTSCQHQYQKEILCRSPILQLANVISFLSQN